MRSLLIFATLVLVAFAACSACSKSAAVGDAPGVIENPGVALFTPVGIGRGCPVGGAIRTARHVLEKETHQGFYSAAWSQGDLNGLAQFAAMSDFVDGAVLEPLGQPPVMVPIGLPTKDLYFYEYSYANRRHAFRNKRRSAKLIREVARYVIFSPAPSPGASGGCLFNDRGEAIGIVVWGFEMNNADEVGVGLLF